MLHGPGKGAAAWPTSFPGMVGPLRRAPEVKNIVYSQNTTSEGLQIGMYMYSIVRERDQKTNM